MIIARLQRSLERAAKAAQREVDAAIQSLALQHARSFTSSERVGEEALRLLERALARLHAAADLGGRVEIRFGPKQAPPEQFVAEIPDVVPSVAFEAAIRDLESRDPFGAADLRRMGLEVESVYGPVFVSPGVAVYPHAFALARAADSEVAAKVKDRLVAGLSQGKATPEVVRELEVEWDWPRAYAEVVVRNNYATATSAGRFREAERVAAVGIPVGFEFQAVMDSATRPGHAALDGMKFRHDDPLLRSWTPPLAPNCRCILSPLVGDDVPQDFQTLPTGAEKDPGYGTRGDLRTYG